VKLEVRGSFFLLIVLMLLPGIGDVLPWTAAAAVCHEMGHFAALRLVGAAPKRLTLSALGAELWADTRYLSYGREIICSLAGPAVNILMAVLAGRVLGNFVWAGANTVLALFNLMPVLGLDGGRALYLAISWAFGPDTADRICVPVSFAVALILAGCGVYLLFCGGGAFLFLGAAGLLLGQLPLVKRGERR